MFGKIIKIIAGLALLGVFGITIFDSLKVIGKKGHLTKLKGFSDVTTSYNKILNRPPLVDIKATKPEKLEEKGYKGARIYKFKGAKGYTTLDGEFSSESKHANAKVFEEEKPRKFTVWRGRSFVHMKYDDNDVIYFPGTKKCQKGYRRCNYDYCVIEYQKCPITKVWVEKEDHKLEEYNDSTKHDTHKINSKHHLVIERENYTHADSRGIVNGLYASLNGFPCYNTKLTGNLKAKEQMTVDQHDPKTTCSQKEQNVDSFHFVDRRKLVKLWEENLEEGYVENLPSDELLKYSQDKVHLFARFVEQLDTQNPTCEKIGTKFIKEFKSHIQGDLKMIENILYGRIGVVFYSLTNSVTKITPGKLFFSSALSLGYYFYYKHKISGISEFLEKLISFIKVNKCVSSDSTYTKKILSMAQEIEGSFSEYDVYFQKFVIIAAVAFGISLLLFMISPGDDKKDQKKTNPTSSGVAQLQKQASKMASKGKKKVKRD